MLEVGREHAMKAGTSAMRILAATKVPGLAAHTTEHPIFQLPGMLAEAQVVALARIFHQGGQHNDSYRFNLGFYRTFERFPEITVCPIQFCTRIIFPCMHQPNI